MHDRKCSNLDFYWVENRETLHLSQRLEERIIFKTSFLKMYPFPLKCRCLTSVRGSNNLNEWHGLASKSLDSYSRSVTAWVTPTLWASLHLYHEYAYVYFLGLFFPMLDIENFAMCLACGTIIVALLFWNASLSQGWFVCFHINPRKIDHMGCKNSSGLDIFEKGV